MKIERAIKAVLIGGSAGSIPVIKKILLSLPDNYRYPVIICIHRMKNAPEGIKDVFSKCCKMMVIEPEDKEPLVSARVYVAPANYHLLIEKDMTFSLSTDIVENFSRPSIDITFSTASSVFKKDLVAILLTGGNSDGAKGLEEINKKCGITIVQDPSECVVPYMPESAIKRNCVIHKMNTAQIINYLKQINENKLLTKI